MIINIALLEDEIKEQEKTIELLNRFAKENECEFAIDFFDNALDIKKTELGKYHLILLDIILDNQKETGFDVAKYIREQNEKVAIVFITKTVSFAIKGYEVNALDYVLKPLSYEDLSLKLKKYIASLLQEKDILLTFKCVDCLLKVKESEIFYFDIYSHYIDIYTAKGIYKCRGKISDIEKIVSSSFARISRNCMINLKHLDEVKKDNAYINNTLLKITDNYKKSFLKSFNLYLISHGK